MRYDRAVAARIDMPESGDFTGSGKERAVSHGIPQTDVVISTEITGGRGAR